MIYINPYVFGNTGRKWFYDHFDSYTANGELIFRLTSGVYVARNRKPFYGLATGFITGYDSFWYDSIDVYALGPIIHLTGNLFTGFHSSVYGGQTGYFSEYDIYATDNIDTYTTGAIPDSTIFFTGATGFRSGSLFNGLIVAFP